MRPTTLARQIDRARGIVALALLAGLGVILARLAVIGTGESRVIEAIEAGETGDAADEGEGDAGGATGRSIHLRIEHRGGDDSITAEFRFQAVIARAAVEVDFARQTLRFVDSGRVVALPPYRTTLVREDGTMEEAAIHLHALLLRELFAAAVDPEGRPGYRRLPFELLRESLSRAAPSLRAFWRHERDG